MMASNVALQPLKSSHENGTEPTPSTPLAAMSPIAPAHISGKEPAIFGTLLGMCSNDVGVYSSHYKSVRVFAVRRGDVP